MHFYCLLLPGKCHVCSELAHPSLISVRAVLHLLCTYNRDKALRIDEYSPRSALAFVTFMGLDVTFPPTLSLIAHLFSGQLKEEYERKMRSLEVIWLSFEIVTSTVWVCCVKK